MMKYNYYGAVSGDIMEYIRENFTEEEIRENLTEDRSSWEEVLNELMWTDDSVTGNASGSYWFSSYKAEQALVGNWDLLRDALYEFGCDNVNPLDKGAEYCDVTIRCYLLGECLAEVLDDLEEEIEREQEEED
jgi:hypothetical protein